MSLVATSCSNFGTSGASLTLPFTRAAQRPSRRRPSGPRDKLSRKMAPSRSQHHVHSKRPRFPLRGIGAPRPPHIGSIKKFEKGILASFPTSDRAHETDIGSGKGVRLAQLAQCEVLRRPFPDTANRPQPPDGIVEPACRVEEVRVGRGGR